MKKFAVMGALIVGMAAFGSLGGVPGATAKPVGGGAPGGGVCQKCDFTNLPGQSIQLARCVSATWFGFTECYEKERWLGGSQYCDYGARTTCLITDGGGIFIP